MAGAPYFIFDLDGTLVDNVYQHVLAWKQALDEEGFAVSTWRVHRRIGMSGSLLVRELARELDSDVSSARIDCVRKRHGEIFKEIEPAGQPLAGAKELLAYLSGHTIAWAIATSGHAENARAALKSLGVDPSTATVITRDQVKSAKPEPDLFVEAAARLSKPIADAWVVGDSIWDMIAAERAKSLSIGLLSGGYAAAELQQAGADRIFDDPADLLLHINELVPPR